MSQQLRLLGLGALLLTTSLSGLLLAGAPGLSGMPPVQLPAGDPPLEVPVLLILQLAGAAVAAAAFFVPKARFLLYGFLTTAISWALVGSTRFPWWLLQSAQNPLQESPGAATILLVGLTTTSLLLYLLVDALQTYQKTAHERGVADHLIRHDMKRIAANYALFCAVAQAVGLLLLTILDRFVADAGWVPELSGDAWGAWILILIGLMLAGVLLMLGRVREPQQPREPTADKS